MAAARELELVVGVERLHLFDSYTGVPCSVRGSRAMEPISGAGERLGQVIERLSASLGLPAGRRC
ncbi:MAG TPA: hypothetical protein VMB51_15510 [Solirubrobacteraceae bacterium]|nr:hypothetical protein [Solirubrobacteraceae bacterium]